MNLNPKLAEEIFGKKYKSKSKKKSDKSSGYHSGDVVLYRNKITVQILDKLDDYVQVSWPVKKPLYNRAVLWVNVSKIAKKQNEAKPKVVKDKKKIKDEKDASGLFGGMFG